MIIKINLDSLYAYARKLEPEFKGSDEEIDLEFWVRHYLYGKGHTDQYMEVNPNVYFIFVLRSESDVRNNRMQECFRYLERKYCITCGLLDKRSYVYM